MFHKSLFMNSSCKSKNIIYPIGKQLGSSNYIITESVLKDIKKIQSQYTYPMANKQYNLIPTNYVQYLHLLDSVQKSITSAGNEQIKLFLKITKDALMASMDIRGLNDANNELTVETQLLQQQIDDILSGKNLQNAAGASNTGQFTLKKSFTLAPLFSYYITLYGMPAAGVGFDQDKLAVLLTVLEKNDIDPYK